MPSISRLTLDHLKEPVIVTDAKHRITGANAALAGLLDYAPAELHDWTLEKIFATKPKNIDQIIAGEIDHANFEAGVTTRSGRRLLLDWTVQPILEDGKITGLLYLGRDTRVHHLVETEIRKARNYFRSIVEQSPYGICVTDLDRHIIIANAAAEHITGHRSEDLIGQPVSLFYATDGGKEDLDPKELKGGKLLTKELDFRRKDGSTVPVRVKYRIAERIGERGTDVIFETYSDLTDRRRLDQLRNEFVFLAAHELRSPVTAIRLLLDLIFEDKRITVDPIMRGYLQNIQEAENRLLQLVDDLLEVSRTEAGRLKITVSPQDMREIVDAILTELKPRAVSREVSFSYAVHGAPPKVLADSSKLKEIMSNLVSNAIKYNVVGGKVTVTHEVQGKMLVTHVADTGIGISEGDQQRLFDKFWRSEDAAVRAQAGTGLGLFIVRELVERMGGHISFKSAHKQGSTFSFSLPIAHEEEK